MNCSRCGTSSVRADQRFCAGCGSDLASGPAAGPTARPAGPTVPAAGPPQPGVEPPPAYHPPTQVTGPLFADDAPHPRPTPTGAPPPAPPYAAVPPQPPGMAPQPSFPAYGDGRRDRRRAPVLLLAVAALVAALVGAGGVVLLLGDENDPTTDTTAEDRRDDADATTDAGSTAPTTATASESASETTEPPTFQCWDGGTVTRLASCSPPTGAAGLAWVFPSATGTTCSTNAGAQRATEADCSPVVGGETVRFHYSEWRDRTALETYYRGNTLEAIGAPSGRADLTTVRVVSRDSDVGYKVAIYYSDIEALWSVTIYAADESQYLAAVAQLEMLPFRQLRGTGA